MAGRWDERIGMAVIPAKRCAAVVRHEKVEGTPTEVLCGAVPTADRILCRAARGRPAREPGDGRAGPVPRRTAPPPGTSATARNATRWPRPAAARRAPAALRARAGVALDAGAARATRGRHELRVYPENPADKSIKLGLIPYHGIAPKLNALQAASDRVSAEVVGQLGARPRPVPGHRHRAGDAPPRAARQDRWRRLIEDDPRAAKRDRELQARVQDAGLDQRATSTATSGRAPTARCGVIERLATATDAATAGLLGAPGCT